MFYVGIKNGKAVYTIKETTVTPSLLTNLKFEETTPEDFKKKIENVWQCKKRLTQMSNCVRSNPTIVEQHFK